MARSGWFELAGSAGGRELLRRAARKCAKQALREWALLRNTPGVGVQARGRTDAYQVLGLTRRNPSTIARKLRVLGKDLPYRSARRGGGDHMMDLLKTEGTGFRITAKNRTAEVETVLKLNGARILNRMDAAQRKYREEFVQFRSDRQQADRIWIEQRYEQLLFAEIDRLTTPKKRGRPKKVQS